jgi:N-acetylglutamate synthase-like GNAT family acetyltransferase
MNANVFLNDAVYVKKGFFISTDKSLLEFNFIFDFLSQQSYWAKGISKETLEIAIKESVCFGVYHQQQQIGFARVISDRSTFAYLAELFIMPEYRKQGLSKWLMQTILAYADFKTLRRWLLATADAHALYAKFGFEPLNMPDRFMQILKPHKT